MTARSLSGTRAWATIAPGGSLLRVPERNNCYEQTGKSDGKRALQAGNFYDVGLGVRTYRNIIAESWILPSI